MANICELCGEEADTEGTSHTGCYCLACHKLVLSECRYAIRQLQDRKRSNQRATKKSATTKEKLDQAYANLGQPDWGKFWAERGH